MRPSAERNTRNSRLIADEDGFVAGEDALFMVVCVLGLESVSE